jgi:hypothetical protein
MGEGTSQNVGLGLCYYIYFVNILGMPCSFLLILLKKNYLEIDEPLDDFFFEH